MKHTSFILRATVAATLGLTAASSFAWNTFGHMVVADVAYRDLQAHAPQLLARVDALLRLNPDYPKWVAGYAASQQQEIAFVQAAHWADDIKASGSGYYADGADGGNTPVEPVASYNLGYAPNDTAMHKYWHFVDNGFSPDGTSVLPTPTPNVTERIPVFEQTLASTTATDALKSYDLVWLIHLVGDIHQPLHASDRFTVDATAGDAGGNLVHTTCSSGCQSTLHATWDDILGTSTSPTSAISYAGGLVVPTGSSVGDPPATWASESLSMAKGDAYSTISHWTTDTHTLGSSYLSKAKSDSRTRVALAGARLSHLLQAYLR